MRLSFAVAWTFVGLFCAAPHGSRRSSSVSYTQEEVRFGHDTISLAGTIFLPRTRGPHPAILLLHGSGPETRLLSSAPWFAERNLVVLTYDKRGTGGSTGQLRLFTYEDLAVDALAGIELLKARSEVDPKHIGVWGPSEGGWVAPIVASRSKDVAFVILKSAIAVNPGEQMAYAWDNELRKTGAPDSTVTAVATARERLWYYVRTGRGAALAAAALERAMRMPGFPSRPERFGIGPAVPSVEWMRDPVNAERVFFVRTQSRFEPIRVLERVKVPVLAIFGEADQDTPVSRSAAILRKVFARSGNESVTVVTIPGADHYLERHPHNRPAYEAPEYQAVMYRWLKEHVPETR